MSFVSMNPQGSTVILVKPYSRVNGEFKLCRIECPLLTKAMVWCLS